MSRSQRIGVVVLAVAIAAAAFVVLRPSDDEDEPQQAAAPTQTTATEQPDASRPRPKPKPRVDTIRVVDGQAAGGVKQLSWDKGETVRLDVVSDAPHEVHLHGYDISKPVRGGGVARFRFDAKLDGIYEIELEDLGQPIAELKVEP